MSYVCVCAPYTYYYCCYYYYCYIYIPYVVLWYITCIIIYIYICVVYHNITYIVIYICMCVWLCACVSRQNFPHLPLVPPLAAKCSAVMPSRCRAASTVNFGCVSRTCTLETPINWGCLGRLKWKVQLNKKKMWNVSEKYMDHVWPTICCDLKQIRMTGSRRKGIEKLKQQASEI